MGNLNVTLAQANEVFDGTIASRRYLAPSGDTTGATDQAALQALFTANPKCTVHLAANSTYYVNKQTTMDNQSLIGNGATISRPAQNATTISAISPVTTNIDTSTTSITVASATGWSADQRFVLYVDGSNYGYGQVVSVNGSVLTVTVTSVSGTLPRASTTIANTFISLVAVGKGKIENVTFNGGAGYTAAGVSTTQKYSRWEVTAEIRTQGMMLVNDCRFYDIAMEGIIEASLTGSTFTTNITGGSTTTVTVATPSAFTVGSFITPFDSTDTTVVLRDDDYRRITDITGSVVTVATPFAKTVAFTNATLINGSIGNRYENNIFERVGGNAIHFSGSMSSLAMGNHINGANLAGGTSGSFPHSLATNHQEGCFTWSNWCMNTRVLNNFVCGTALAAFGSLDSTDNSNVIISANVVKDCIGNVINMTYGNTGSILNVTISNNHFRDCGPLLAYSNTSVSSGKVHALVISGNTWTGVYSTNKAIDLYYAKDCSIVNNTFDFNATTTPNSNNIAISLQSCMNCKISGNTFMGWFTQILVLSDSKPTWQGRISIMNNLFAYYYGKGVYIVSPSVAYDYVIDSNSFADWATTSPGYVAGMLPYVVTSGAGCAIRFDSDKAVARSNNITCYQANGRGIIVGGNNCVLENNIITKGVTSAAGIELVTTTTTLVRNNLTCLVNSATGGTITLTSSATLGTYTVDSSTNNNVTVMP